MKAGTTWFDLVLRSHPGLALPEPVKETFFFDRYFPRGAAWYDEYFPNKGTSARRTEVCPTYALSSDAAIRYSAIAPANSTVAILVRDPVKRALSHLRHSGLKGYVSSEQFEVAVMEDPEIVRGSEYSICIETWERYLPNHHVDVLVLEHLLSLDGSELLEHLSRTLRLDPWPESTPIPTAVNTAVASRNPTVSRVAYQLSNALHRRGMHKAVAVARRFGRPLFVRAVHETRDSEADTEIANVRLAGLVEREAEFVEGRTGIAVRKYWGMAP